MASANGRKSTQRKRQVVSDFRRAEIVNAARSVFARKGFTRAIIAEIAKEAGVAKGTVYLYFRSKKEIYRAVLNADMEFLTNASLQRIDAAPTLREKIKAFVLLRVENSDAKREFFKIMDIDFGSLSFTRSQYRNWLREPVLRLAAAIESAYRQGEIRCLSPERTAWAIADMSRGIIQRRLVSGDCTPAADEAEFLTDFICAALNPQAAH